MSMVNPDNNYADNDVSDETEVNGNGITLGRTVEERIAYVLEHLRQKYNEDFEYVSKIGGSWGTPERTYLVQPTGQEDKIFGVSIWIRNDAERGKVKDGYYHIAIRDEYNELVETTVHKVFPECKIMISVNLTHCSPDELVTGVSLKDAYNMGLPYVTASDIYIMVKKDDSVDYQLIHDQIVEMLLHTVAKKGVSIYVLPDKLYDMFGNEQKSWVKLSYSGARYIHGADIDFDELRTYRNQFDVVRRIGEGWL